MLRSAYARVPARYRMFIGQLRRGRFRALTGDDPALARSVWLDRGQDWADRYWDDTRAPQRAAMLQALGRMKFDTLLELGCNSGPNLRLIHEQFPHARLTGIDISEDAVQCANRRFAGIDHVCIEQGPFDRIDGSYDVIFSMWSLCCSPPSEVRRVLASASASAHTLVVIEPCCEGPSQLATPLPTWRHDYAGTFAGLGMKVEAHPVSLDGIDRVVVASKA
jgi:Methyltransferase domain